MKNFLKRFISLACVCSAAALAGCAAANLQADTAAQAKASACCSSVSTLPKPIAYNSKQELEFATSSPHFDFGEGLVPFVRVALNPGQDKFVALLSAPRGSGRLFGGDGTFHYAGLRPTFFTASGEKLSKPELTPPIMRTYGAMGSFMHLQYAAVPNDAAVMLITTSRSDAGKQGENSGSVPGGGMMIGSTFIPLQGGSQTFKYTLSPYGQAVVLFSPNPPKL